MPPTVPIHVNIVWDPTVGYNTHTLWDPAATATVPPPGVPKPSVPTYAIEMIATQMWTAGYLLGQNKFTEDVFHLGMPICIDDHDQGILIPDVTIPLPNLWYAIQWPFSSRKMAFKASTVQMGGKPVSCAQMLPFPLPMQTCGDPMTLPLSFPIVNCTHPLTVGITAGDLILGVINVVATAAIDAFFEWGVPGIGKFIAGKLGKEVAEEVGETLGRKLFFEAMGKLGVTPKSFAKNVVNGLAGWGAAEATGQDNPSFKVEAGGGPLPKVGFEAGGDPDDPGRWGNSEVGGVPVSGTAGNTPGDPLDIF